MKSSNLFLALATSAALGFAGTAVAQQDGKDATVKPRGSNATAPANTPQSDIGAGNVNPGSSASGMTGSQSHSGANQSTTSQRQTLPPHAVIGWPVMNRAGEEIGTVDGIVRDRSNMQNYALVDVGDFLAAGDRQVLVPLDSLRVGANNTILMSQGDTKADLQRVPAWDRAAGSYDVRVGDATRPENELRWGADPVVDSGAKPDHTNDTNPQSNNNNNNAGSNGGAGNSNGTNP